MVKRRIAVSTAVFAAAIAVSAGVSDPDVKNAWTGFAEGAWVAFEWSEQWGTNPATTESRRTVLTEHRSIGTSLTETERHEAGDWKRITGGLHGAYPPDAAGMARTSETPERIEVAGVPTSCMRREYVHDEADGSGQRLVLWHCDGVELASRVLPQWSVSFGWQLAPDVARALIERRDEAGAVTSVELELDDAELALDIGGQAVGGFSEKLTWRHRMAGQPQGRITTETTRWLSAEVPGLVARQIDDNMMGRISTIEVRNFGTKPE